jgi:uncharacterized protein (TIGR04255 family)
MAPEPSLPSFERPPLNEVVLSVQFDPLFQLHPALLGLFWGTIKDQFPNVQSQPAIDPVIERVGVSGAVSTMPIFFQGNPAPRLWFLNTTGNELIQVQQDRFLRNWRQIADSDQYPRYEEHIRPRFCDDYGRFLAFLRAERVAEPAPNQCEVTYVNVIQSLQASDTHADLEKVLRSCQTDIAGVDGLIFEDGRFLLRYQIMDGQSFVGRLHISVEPQLKRSDGSPIILLSLTARGRPLGEGIQGVLDFFDLGRRMIVKTFAAITTNEMQSVWGRTDVR